MFYMTPHIADKFTKHLEPIKAIPSVDRGGCGFVALNIYKTLSSLGYNAKIISCDRYYSGYNETLARRKKHKGCDAADHYVVRVHGIYFDSHGAMSFKDLCNNRMKGPATIHPIYKIDLEWIIDHGAWNEEFYSAHRNDLNQTIEFIESHIGSFKIGNNQNRNKRLNGKSHRLTEAPGNCS